MQAPRFLDTEAVLALQRRAGNRAITALLQRARLPPPTPPPVVDADAAAQAINTWIQNNAPPGQQANYSVGVAHNGDIYISKVGGVTSKTPFIQGTLASYIAANRYQVGRDIFLAKQYNTSLSSGNHAEMCIMAAAGQGELSKIYCAAPHCAFCAAMMDTDNVALGAQRGDSHQNGWAHPYAPILFGSSINNDTDAQLDKLKLLPVNPTEDGAQKAGVRWWSTSPTQGSREPWL